MLLNACTWKERVAKIAENINFPLKIYILEKERVTMTRRGVCVKNQNGQSWIANLSKEIAN